MKVQRIELENYKALQGKHEFDLKGCSFFVIGGNGQGKTTVSRLVMDILTKNLPTTPVTQGEKQGYVEVTLDNNDKIYYRFNDTGKPQLEIISANGGKFSNVSDLFKTMAGNGMAFDINEFLKMAPKPRRAMLEKIAGVDFTAINEAEKLAEFERTGINARLKDAKARVVPFDVDLVTKEKVNITELSQQLNDMTAFNNKAVNAATEVQRLLNEGNDISAQIKALQEKLTAISVRVKEGTDWLESNKPHTPETIEAVKTQLSEADNINRSIDAAKTAKTDFDFATDLEAKAKLASDKVVQVRAEKDSLIKAAKLPADGLTFSEDGETLLIDGFVFEDAQVATSRKMIAAIQIAESLLGSIKFLQLDASILDKTNAEKLLTWAESKGLQLALERSVWEGGELKFEVYEPKTEA